MNKPEKHRLAAGLTLIVLGVVFYVLERSRGFDRAALLLIIGSGLLAAYLYWRQHKFLVPAGILLGLGVGFLVEETRYDFGRSTLWGLGLGFVAIYVVALAYERKSSWWPLIPGAVLILLGLPVSGGIVNTILRSWPLVLVLVGVLILISGFRGRPRGNKSG
jgi:drug/metabolite transporter (DMT)-like permease